jgi:PIN domain nuclease of toxin-antitoxin system
VKLLLDTCTFLWIAAQTERLSDAAVGLFRDPANEVFLSSVSAWEIAIKYSLGKIELSGAPDQFVPLHRGHLGTKTLDLDEASALQLTRLPALHRDPFDRMLVCQAIDLGMVLLTPDRLLSQHPARTLW